MRLYVVAFEAMHANEPAIITQRGGRLLMGRRTAVRSIERDANEIALEHQIRASAHARLLLPNAEYPNTQGFSIRPATHTALPDMADFTHHSTPTKHQLPLELHNLSDLTERLSNQEGREVELGYLRAFGDFVLNRA
jgi:hypothetical protein